MGLIRILIFGLLLSGCGTHVLVSQKTCKKNDYQLGKYSEEKTLKKQRGWELQRLRAPFWRRAGNVLPPPRDLEINMVERFIQIYKDLQ